MNRYEALLNHFRELKDTYKDLPELNALIELLDTLRRAHDDYDVETFQQEFSKSIKKFEKVLKELAEALKDIQEEVTGDIKDLHFEITKKMRVQFVDANGNSHIETFNPVDGYFFTANEPRVMRLSGRVGFAIYQRIIEEKPYLFFSALQGSMNVLLTTRNQGELVRGKLDHVLKSQVLIGEPYYIYVTEGRDHSGPHRLIGWLRVYS